MLFLRRFLINLRALSASVAAGMAVSRVLPIDNYAHWAICACVSCLLIGMITLAVNFVFCRGELTDALKKYRK